MPTKDINVTGGANYAPAFGQKDNLVFQASAWTASGWFTINLSSPAGNATLGKGNLASTADTLLPICGLTLSNRVYVGVGQQFLFSGLDSISGWEQQDVGAGFVDLITQYGQQDNVLAMASYQGRLAVYGRYSVQIWVVNADPLLFSRTQTLPNTGTVSQLSVQSLGDMDVLSLNAAGVWSLRVRDSSLGAMVVDIGSAVQPIMQSVQIEHPTSGPSSCAVVEPTTNSYWLFLYDRIYVLSYYPSAKITAWSTFIPTDSDGKTFVPEKFVVFNGQVYVRGTVAGVSRLFLYGGADNATYDASLVRVRLPWLSGQGRGKTPASMKQATGVDVIMQGRWTVKASMDYLNDSDASFTTLLTEDQPTPEKGRMPFEAQGTHFSLIAETQDAAVGGVVPTLSSLIFHFQEGNEK